MERTGRVLSHVEQEIEREKEHQSIEGEELDPGSGFAENQEKKHTDEQEKEHPERTII